jgi:hypothetical protein
MIRKVIRFAGWKVFGMTQWLHIRVVRILGRSRVLPLEYWVVASATLNQAFQVRNSLFPENPSPSPGESVGVDELRGILSGYSIGGMRLDKHAIAFLWRNLLQDRPSVLFECGSGLSTLILAAYARKCESEGKVTVRIISVDQSPTYVTETESILRTHGLGSYVQLYTVPLDFSGSYDFGAIALSEILNGKGPEWILVDGPFGPPGCRERSLTDISHLCKPGARWFLDDAFRDAEIGILRRWKSNSKIRVDGIIPTEAGLATGHIRPPG